MRGSTESGVTLLFARVKTDMFWSVQKGDCIDGSGIGVRETPMVSERNHLHYLKRLWSLHSTIARKQMTDLFKGRIKRVR
tara:strand:- start:121 stop:360 length:240 start_codon:yes stop_codon:yes gene_type:complete